MPPETAGAAQQRARLSLAAAGIESAALDARLLLQDVLKIDHAGFIAAKELLLTDEELRLFEAHVARRLAHEPVSRIVGHREFFGRDFLVSPATLDPRPDTETLIEEALAFLKGKAPCRILDLGTGSGAIIVSLLAERPLDHGVATDISKAALETARANARRHDVLARLSFHQASWFDGLQGRFQLIVSNPPYIPVAEILALALEVRGHDPHLALDGGPDGLEAYRRIARSAAGFMEPEAQVLVEIGAGQAPSIIAIFEAHGYAIVKKKADLSGQIRVLSFAV
jgi:release factor glutamine methyltransferase